jgi:hypothetical protein
LVELWTGVYDISEEEISGEQDESPLAPLIGQERVQINVRRVPLAWLGTHVLYVEEYPYDEPFELRRRLLLAIELAGRGGTLRVRQFTRRAPGGAGATLDAADVQSEPGCDLLLKREGTQFRGGTVPRACPDGDGRWLDYRVVIGEGLFWYRKRTMSAAGDEVVAEIAGFPHVDLDEARLFSCGVSWAPPRERGPRRALESVDLHDRGGRARLRTPDGRQYQLELHGRDWPLSAGRESLVLILTADGADAETIASSWTSLNAARVGIDIGWLAVDCAPVVSVTGEERS